MIVFLSTSDTDLLTAKAATESSAEVQYRWANPNFLNKESLGEYLDGADVVVVRLLGGKRATQ